MTSTPRLSAFAPQDLCVDLVSTRIEQLYRVILELPHIAVVTQIGIVCIDPLARDQLRGFQP